ncbi:probably inactive leucine-rich repeat receptor-like protein kinase At5g48380 [Prunus avium]|uniref:Probably inactive leucine-rich repeat receptor-like protein kinase At5g48380 n=1 Tax=Prunus avium TaxID=42229 RepID=A0A6P5SRV2_PRUAV|nr:probably inactive leucine-rich repeat receptor-like protein kinase At5g48380 [Prunus avium]
MAFLMPVLLSKRNLDMFISSVFWLLLLSCSFSFGVESDINCLKSIKASLEDTSGYLNSSWDFSNNTEGFICNFLGIECWHPNESKVLNIKLSNLGLKGQFPRGVENCTSLTGLDLSRNRLSGDLPHDIDRILTFVTSLDLSSNSFSGPIPAKLFNCSYMNVLKLDNNQFSADSYANNPGLCGYPLKPCPSISQMKSLNVVTVFKSNGVIMVAAAGYVLSKLHRRHASFEQQSAGQIPDLPNCTWLNLLKLDDNAFNFLGLRNSVWPTIFCLGRSHSSFMGLLQLERRVI